MNEIVEFCLKTITRVPCSPTTYKTLSVLTEKRAQLCARVAEVSSPLIMHIHNSTHVEQISGTPDHSVCAVTQKPLPSKYGVQIKYDHGHICVHADVAELMYHYFCIRHFPLFMCGRIRNWLQTQPWFAGHVDVDIQKIIRSNWEPIIRREYRLSTEYLESFVQRSAQKPRTLLK